MRVPETKKGASPGGATPVEVFVVGLRSARRRLAGAFGESAEGVGVADGDVREHLSIQLDAGLLEAEHELGVRHALTPRGGVDPGDPQAPEVPLAVAPVPVG